MFITALSPIAKIWKLFKCPWTDKWIKKCVYTHTHTHTHTHTEIMPFPATWMDLEIIILSEVSQRQIYDIAYMWNF